MKCFYHSVDLDGKCSAAIVKRFIGNQDCQFIGITYGNNFPWGTIKEDETVYIVDYSMSMDDLYRLNEIADLVWIDHHKTAVEAEVRHKTYQTKKIHGRRKIGMAGCELTWQYLFPKEKMPEAVRLLGRYDVWDHVDPKVLPFQYGMRLLKNTSPDSYIWEVLLDHGTVDNIVNDGEIVLAYEKQQNTIKSRSLCFPLIFEGYKFLAANVSHVNSKFFNDQLTDGYDGMLTFALRSNSLWGYGIYSPENGIDVSEIAKKYGGGGHKHAAGFSTKKLIFGG